MQCACKCKGRWVFLTICSFQLVSCIDLRDLLLAYVLLLQLCVFVRLVFDSLGLLWTPIVACICQILGVIIGIIGVLKIKYRVVCLYSTWTLVWIGWNVYLICYYLELGHLNIDQHSITMDLSLTNSSSWFSEGGSIICGKSLEQIEKNINVEMDAAKDCLIDYKYVEAGLSVLQILLASFGFIASCYMIGILDDEDEYDYIAANLADKKHNNDDSYQPRTRVLLANT